MLADPAFCDLAYTIGVASLGANEKQIWHLTKLYWYTVEFGVVREKGEIKAFGAGTLAQYLQEVSLSWLIVLDQPPQVLLLAVLFQSFLLIQVAETQSKKKTAGQKSSCLP